MKKNYVLVSPGILISFFFVLCSCGSNVPNSLKEHFDKQIGTYVLDRRMTKLGGYVKDSIRLRNMTITFSRDSTFILNMDVPFFKDSIGKWEPDGLIPEDWGHIYYKNDRIKNSQGGQMVKPWTTDSIFYINSATPKPGFESIGVIYFRKLFNKSATVN